MSTRSLLDVIGSIEECDGTQTVFAEEPWKPSSSAKLFGEVETTEDRDGLAYFLEVEIISEVLSSTDGSLETKCNRVIAYAINDC